MRRTLSTSDIARDSTDANVSIYRSPIRDALGDDQSVIDRTSEVLSMRYDDGFKQSEHKPLPTAPAEFDFTRQFNNLSVKPKEYSHKIDGSHGKPSKIAVFINPYEDGNEKESIETWIEKFELMADTNNWTEKYKRNMLLFNLADDAYTYALDLYREHGDISYDALKSKLIDRFTNKFNASIDFHNMSRRRFRKGEKFLTYWNDKVELMRRVDPDMSFHSRLNHIIDGLDFDLFREVLKYNNLNRPSNMDELFHAINNLNQIEISSRSMRELNGKSVRFDDAQSQNKNNKMAGRTFYPHNNGGYNRNNNGYGQSFNNNGGNRQNNQRTQFYNRRWK